MTIDQNQTPVGEEEAQQSATAAAQAPDPSSETETPTETPTSETLVPQETVVTDQQVQVSTEPEVQQVQVTTDPEVPAEADNQQVQVTTEPEPTAEAQAETPVATEPEAVAEEPVAPAAVVEPEVAPAAVPAAEPAEATSRDVKADADLFEAAMRGDFGEDMNPTEGGFKRLQKGERIEATIIQVDKDKVFVDLGTKAEGIVPLGELSDENLETAKGRFNVGDKISVIVIRPEGAEGNPIVSKRRAEFEEAWDKIEEAFKIAEEQTSLDKWKKVGDIALMAGQFELAEKCFDKSQDFNSLLLFYSSYGDH